MGRPFGPFGVPCLTSIGLYREDMSIEQIFLSETTRRRALIIGMYYVASITSWTSTTIVQIMPLGPKMAQPQVSHGFHRLNTKT